MRTSKPAQEDYDTLPVHELASSYPCGPESDVNMETYQRIISNKKLSKIRRNLKKISVSTILPISEWQKRTAGAPIDVASKTLDCETQLAMKIECEHR